MLGTHKSEQDDAYQRPCRKSVLVIHYLQQDSEAPIQGPAPPVLQRYAKKILAMNYHDWTECVRAFSEGLRMLPGEIDITIEIDPPLESQQIDTLADRWSNGLPASLRQLWSEGSARVNCPYVWTPSPDELPSLNEVFEDNDYIYGGARFEHAEQIYPGNSGADAGDEDMAAVLGKAGLELWCRCAVFLHVGNGDCLGLDPESDAEDPSVVYLVHDDDESSVISPSFSEFLAAWQELCYIGPEFWLLDYWIDGDRGVIDTTKNKTAELHRLLTRRPQTTKA
ncbi:SMI1/KNR4 family protein [Haloferula rosea]|nr:SMI1/KNR4 family protein [Haloferula rosea]